MKEGAPPVSGTRAALYLVVLHVDADTLEADAEPGRSELEDGSRLSAETSRRIAYDAGLVRITHRPDGSVFDVGRKTRTIPPSLRRALEARDRGCRFPDHSPSASGARGLRFCDAHHVRHWADGGETSMSNCVLLCKSPRPAARGRLWGSGRPVFFDPRGGTHFEGRWQPPELGGDLVRKLVAEHRARGIEPDWSTAGAHWTQEAHIPDDVYFRALEGMG